MFVVQLEGREDWVGMGQPVAALQLEMMRDERCGRRQKWERRLHVAAVHHEVTAVCPGWSTSLSSVLCLLWTRKVGRASKKKEARAKKQREKSRESKLGKESRESRG